MATIHTVTATMLDAHGYDKVNASPAAGTYERCS